MNGLHIDAVGFSKLPQRQQLVLLYENTEQLKKMIANYKFNQKIQWTSILIIGISLGLTKFFPLL